MKVRHVEQPEFLSQAALFDWARMPAVIKSLPGIELLEGSMNGVRLSKAQAGKAKAAGMLKGSHDVRLPVARGRWIGLSIELKYGDNMPSDEQLEIGTMLEREGWRVHYIWEWTDAVKVITEFLSLPRPAITPCS
ncbi:hypothetical protein M0D69_13800 [Caballeronia sp. SEWSISQ10-4 2]|uniref:hypothetical protein n=1 Tax=Caballeronia sp. SEWSISQ10-4 2 TaxID=2937438 RepID=UPI00264F08DD|nr:hypothetical protein [Caballeronia sp. SEWSISQ10-4 2]MDN7179067.1 hypothetical protein [Caballeronia sp. SEWSISQ10-4 2]